MAKNERIIALRLDRAQFEKFLADAPANGMVIAPSEGDSGIATITEHKVTLHYAWAHDVLVVEGVSKPWKVPYWSLVANKLKDKAKEANLEILA